MPSLAYIEAKMFAVESKKTIEKTPVSMVTMKGKGYQGRQSLCDP